MTDKITIERLLNYKNSDMSYFIELLNEYLDYNEDSSSIKRLKVSSNVDIDFEGCEEDPYDDEVDGPEIYVQVVRDSSSFSIRNAVGTLLKIVGNSDYIPSVYVILPNISDDESLAYENLEDAIYETLRVDLHIIGCNELNEIKQN